ncbi:hypothetical protein [Halovenus amylolytica]|uniref:hypothetical protein n=1 Tax=Halovenus amylolytica TaxID=2500550 RepID=UPI003D6B17F0
MLVIVVGLVGFYVVSLYNQLVRLGENVDQAAQNIDVLVNYPSLLPRRIRASVLEGGALMWTPGDQLSAVGR